MFSVAPTDGNSSWIRRRATNLPGRQRIRVRYRIGTELAQPRVGGMSSGREPMASPPGRATFARLQRPTRGPRTQTEARFAKSASYFGSSGEVIRTTSPSSSTVALQNLQAQHLGHQGYVEDVRAIAIVGALCEQAGRHQLEHAVLGSRDGHFVRQPASARPRNASLTRQV